MIKLYLIHPLLVHFTIALFSISIIFDLIAIILKKANFHTAAWFNLFFAGPAAIATVVFGFIAKEGAPHTDAAHDLMRTHETIGLVVLGIIMVLAIWRGVLRGRIPGKGLWLYLILSLSGAGLMLGGAYYGGELVYTHGYGVKTIAKTADHLHSEETSAKKKKSNNKIEILRKSELPGHAH